MQKQNKKERTLSGRNFREFVNQIAELITAENDAIHVCLRGNTFNIDLCEASINITVSEKGGQK